MNCRETERLLDTFFDGELEGRLMRDAALHITRCPSCERELRERERLQDLLSQTVEEEVAAVDLESVWAGVQRGLADDAERVPEGILAAAVSADAARDGGRRAAGLRGGSRSASPSARPSAHVSARAARARTMRRVSVAAGVGVVAVGLAAVLLFPGEPDLERTATAPERAVEEAGGTTKRTAPMAVAREQLPSSPGTFDAVGAAPAVATSRGAGSGHVVTMVSSSSGDERALASAGELPVEPVALGPVAVSLGGPLEDALMDPEWAQQVQVGPLDYHGHAMAWWSEPDAR